MNIMKLYSDLCAVVRSFIKIIYVNILNGGGYKSHAIVRIQSHVKIVIDTGSKIYIGKGALIESYSKISASGGGVLILGRMVGINRKSMIMCHDYISIGDNTIMGPDVCIYDHDHVFNSLEGVKRNEYISSPVTIGKNCWIGAGTIILRGTTIGDNCLIAAGCVVKGCYPEGSVVIQKRYETISQKGD